MDVNGAYRRAGDVTSRRKGIAMVLPILCLVSCTNEDRMAVVTCLPPPSDNISVDLGTPETERLVGYLNTGKLVPGTILQLHPPAAGQTRGSGTVFHIERISDSDFVPPQVEFASEGVITGRFKVQVDDDVGQALNSLHIDLERNITRNTVIGNFSAERKILRDPLGVINTDSPVIQSIREGEKKGRFIVVSGASYGNEIQLFYDGWGSAGQTVDVPNFYLHLKYECSAITKLNSSVSASNRKEPILLFFTAIKFDQTSGLVVLDTTPLDLATFDLAQ